MEHPQCTKEMEECSKPDNSNCFSKPVQSSPPAAQSQSIPPVAYSQATQNPQHSSAPEANPRGRGWLGDVLLELRMAKARTLARDVEKDLRKQLQDLRSSLCPLGLIRPWMFGDLRGSSIDLSLLLCLY